MNRRLISFHLKAGDADGDTDIPVRFPPPRLESPRHVVVAKSLDARPFPGQLSHMRILVVEDEIKLARFIVRGLKEERFTVDVAHDGEEGLHLALGVPYDVIVLDVRLPRLDGFEVLRALRAAGNPSRVLMLTARDGVEDRVRGLDEGADDYLTKPFAFAEFLARVRALLRRSNSSDSTTLTVADLVLNLKTQKITRADQPVSLTAREFSVLAIS